MDEIDPNIVEPISTPSVEDTSNSNHNCSQEESTKLINSHDSNYYVNSNDNVNISIPSSPYVTTDVSYSLNSEITDNLLPPSNNVKDVNNMSNCRDINNLDDVVNDNSKFMSSSPPSSPPLNSTDSDFLIDPILQRTESSSDDNSRLIHESQLNLPINEVIVTNSDKNEKLLTIVIESNDDELSLAQNQNNQIHSPDDLLAPEKSNSQIDDHEPLFATIENKEEINSNREIISSDKINESQNGDVTMATPSNFSSNDDPSSPDPIPLSNNQVETDEKITIDEIVEKISEDNEIIEKINEQTPLSPAEINESSEEILAKTENKNEADEESPMEIDTQTENSSTNNIEESIDLSKIDSKNHKPSKDADEDDGNISSEEEGFENDENEEIVSSPVEKVEEEDLEEGEIEDDDEPPPPVHKEEKKKKESSREKSSKNRDKSESKDKKEKKSNDKKRKHSKDEERAAKKRIKRLDEVEIGSIEEDDFLFVRGGRSPSPLPSLMQQQEEKYYEVDPFGHPIYEEDMEESYPTQEKRKPKSKSPSASERKHRKGEREESNRNNRPNSQPTPRPSSAHNKPPPIKPAHKTDQICAYYMQGKCQKSHEECSYSHNAVPPRKMELCKFWMLDCCAKKEKCLYLHNDFPCKFYHTGLVCKQGLKNQCKFSHKPLNEVTKAVLLKHIETAPKEILGDFPRLSRQGALNLISKMEAKLEGDAWKERDRELENRRRTRWEHPTRDDEHKLHLLMEEAGIGELFNETVEPPPPPPHVPPPHILPLSTPPPPINLHQYKNIPPPINNRGPGLMPTPPPLLSQMPPKLPPPILSNPALPPQIGNNSLGTKAPPPLLVNPAQVPQIVNNPTLANVLATLQIPSTSIKFDGPPPQSKKEKVELNPTQRDIFRRIQEREEKSEVKKEKETKEDENSWYSDEDEEGSKKSLPLPHQPLSEALGPKKEKEESSKENKTVVDFASMLSAIRKNVSSSSTPPSNEAETSSHPPLNFTPNLNYPPPSVTNSSISIDGANSKNIGVGGLGHFPGRGDVDFRIGANSSSSTNSGNSSNVGPFHDTDFRVQGMSRKDLFKDVDLRNQGLSPVEKPTNSSSSASASIFRSMPTGPASMIDASINSHPPIPWSVVEVDGVDKPDYGYIKHTLSQAQLSLDPRFGPRTSGANPLIEPNISSSSNVSSSGGTNSGEGITDPRVNRRGVDSRPLGASGSNSSPNTNVWGGGGDLSQAALAAQFIAASQLGLLQFPNPPFTHPPPSNPHPSRFSSGPTPPNLTSRLPSSNQHSNSTPPSSSWERYSQQQAGEGGLTPPLQ